MKTSLFKYLILSIIIVGSLTIQTGELLACGTLTLTASPHDYLLADGNSKITIKATLRAPDGTQVTDFTAHFSVFRGSGTVSPLEKSTTSGTALTKYTSSTVPSENIISAWAVVTTPLGEQTVYGSTKVYALGAQIKEAEGADYIGDVSSTQSVFATNVNNSYATVKLDVLPSSFTVPNGLISWWGGLSGVDQFHRKISRSGLRESGVSLTASILQKAAAKAKVYIFAPRPVASDVEVKPKIKKDNSITTVDVPAGTIAFGKTTFIDSLTPVYTIESYYLNKKWKFVLKKISYEIKWGINDHERADVKSGEMNPFPNGYLMPKKSSQFERKTQAKRDLTPDSRGEAFYHCYWTSALVTKHEKFHISDWLSYYEEWMKIAESNIENVEVPVTLYNLDSNAVITDKTPGFDIEIYNKTIEANKIYHSGAEDRAYADGKFAHQVLADSIKP